MRKLLMAVSVLLFCYGSVYSQEMMDAYKYSSSDLSGTARSMGMGGAFGALGGDISAMSTNPAGLAVYRSSEVVTTLSLSSIGTKTNWFGNKEDNNRVKFDFDNIAYVGYFPTGNDEGLVSWNFGISYNRLKNFRRNYSMTAVGGTNYSLSDYTATVANLEGYMAGKLENRKDHDPYAEPNIDWLSILGYNAGYMREYNDNNQLYYSTFTNQDGSGFPMSSANLVVSERGYIDQYNIAFGMNISDIFMLGGTVKITDLDYNQQSYYTEIFDNGSSLTLGNDQDGVNGLSTDGTGYGFNIGVIVRPADYLRLGVAYNSPTWYKMTDYYRSGASADTPEFTEEVWAHTPDQAAGDYEYRTPDKWIFSAAAIIGQYGLISVDYELTNYKRMKLYYADGVAKDITNDRIENAFGMGNTIRVGAEAKITPQFAVRVGGGWTGSPLTSSYKNGSQEIITGGTIPHFTLDQSMSYYTVGLGYRFTPSFYADLACVFRTLKEDAYAFSSIPSDVAGEYLIKAEPATLKTNTTKVALTLGYKF